MVQGTTHPVGEAASAVITPRVLVFFDYACQFCYLDWPRFKRLRAEHGVDLFVVPYELRPAMPAEGVDIAEFGGGHSPRVEEHMRKMAAEGGLELAFPAFVPNTHYALAVGEYARDTGPEAHEAVHEALFEAYNAHGRDIGALDVVLDVAETHALDRDDVELALVEGRYDERIHQFLHLGLSFGVTATPSALICNELFIGSRPYKVLADSVNRCLVKAENVEEHLHGDGERPQHVHGEAGSQGASVSDLAEEAEAEAEVAGEPPSIAH